jgi:protein TonB
MSARIYAPAFATAPVRRKRRISREATVAIGLSLLVHAAVFGYLATQKFATFDTTPEDFHPFDFTTEHLPPTPTAKHLPQKLPVPIHDPDRVNPPPDTVKAIEAPPTQPQAHTDEPPAEIATEPPPKVVQMADNRTIEPPRQRVIRNPSWLQRPTGRQLADLYPRIAAERGISGGATLMCEVIGTGAVRNCAVIDESPKGRGFGEAALASARLFKLNPRTVDGEAVEGAKVRIPLVFNLAE